MSPRSNRPRRRRGKPVEPEPERPLFRGVERAEDGWIVRSVAGSPDRTYRCPGCDQEIARGVPHVVAWLEDGLPTGMAGPDNRRHWHTACWRARGHRGPSAPRPARPRH